ncbi:hypothetical protein PTTG_26252 [Puccinia triticina 1-1 BBBD Race 1]|uniref:Retrotransposon Copia-like N-terminal domain-containing protein n=1 Tax=Puccinia triticina (isolate 1-1 / race 1 (BBBD)) TaxID=630390 RepID=A0A180GVJ9_PUCT1|nr:hypothetical protein PTTG_26252 [Puccinia triticina 1-1 BBBD Race 1]
MSQSSSNEVVSSTKICIKKLNQTNYWAWRYHMDNYMVGRGDEDLFESKYYEQKPLPPNYKKRNAGAISLLLSVVSDELHHEIQAHETFLNAWNALSTACGNDSVVFICEKLFELLSLEFEPQSSLQAQISKFKSLYTELTVLTTDKTFMDISTGLAAAFFLQSIKNDEALAALVQTLYDVKPFNLQSVTDCIGMEHIRRGGEKESEKDKAQVDQPVAKALLVEDVVDIEEWHQRFIQTQLRLLNKDLPISNGQ